MIHYGEIDYFRKTLAITKEPETITIEKENPTVSIDRIISTWLLEKEIKQIFIDTSKKEIVRVYVPTFSDWIILQNEYLPCLGEYFLN